MNVGFIGGGNITDTHIRAALAIPSLKIAAIFGSNAQKVNEHAKKYGGAAFDDFDRFLAHRPLDMVIIGSPSGLHASHGIAAANQGLHVLTEKPIDVSTYQADRLIAAAKRAGVKLGVLVQDRLKPDILRLKGWIDSGKLGRPLLVDAAVKWYRPPEYYSTSKWRGTRELDGGGALINQGVHTVDLLLYLLGDVTRVQAVNVAALHDIEVEDTCVATLEFSNGAVGALHATTAAYPGYPRSIEITGTEGTVRLEADRIARADLKTPLPAEEQVEPVDQNASASSPVVSDVRGHQRIIEDFVRSIESDAVPSCDGEQGRRSLALVEAIYQAGRSREAVACG